MAKKNQSEGKKLKKGKNKKRKPKKGKIKGKNLKGKKSKKIHPKVGKNVKSGSSGVKYPVLPDIGELNLPLVEGHEEAKFVFGDGEPGLYGLGSRHTLLHPLPRIPRRGNSLKVVSELVGSGITEVNYFFYDLMEGEDCYTFYKSRQADGRDAEVCGIVSSIVTDLNNTTLNAKGALDGGSPIIIIGTINIDPTVILQQTNSSFGL